MRYDNANLENIRTDLNDTMRTIKDKYISCKANELCNIFKVDLIKSIETNIPHKITYKNRLPWVTNNVRKHINKQNKAYNKRKTNPTKYKTLKHQVQKELRKAYYDYIEKIICDLPIGEPDQHIPSNVKPKKNYLVISKAFEQTTLVQPL